MKNAQQWSTCLWYSNNHSSNIKLISRTRFTNFIEICSHGFQCSQSCTAITMVNFRTFLSLQKDRVSVSSHSSFLSNLSQPQATTNLLSISLGLPVLDISYKCDHVIGGLYKWLLSLSIMFSRFIHVVVGISTSFLLMAK